MFIQGIDFRKPPLKSILLQCNDQLDYILDIAFYLTNKVWFATHAYANATSHDLITWSHHMILSHDHITWSHHMITSNDSIIWSHDHITWSHHMIQSYDHIKWCRHMITSHDGVTWSHHMIPSHDFITWSHQMIPSHDHITWSRQSHDHITRRWQVEVKAVSNIRYIDFLSSIPVTFPETLAPSSNSYPQNPYQLNCCPTLGTSVVPDTSCCQTVINSGSMYSNTMCCPPAPLQMLTLQPNDTKNLTLSVPAEVLLTIRVTPIKQGVYLILD